MSDTRHIDCYFCGEGEDFSDRSLPSQFAEKGWMRCEVEVFVGFSPPLQAAPVLDICPKCKPSKGPEFIRLAFEVGAIEAASHAFEKRGEFRGSEPARQGCTSHFRHVHCSKCGSSRKDSMVAPDWYNPDKWARVNHDRADVGIAELDRKYAECCDAPFSEGWRKLVVTISGDSLEGKYGIQWATCVTLCPECDPKVHEALKKMPDGGHDSRIEELKKKLTQGGKS